MTPVEDIAPTSPAEFEQTVRPGFRPVVMRGVARDWPLVRAAEGGAEAALATLSRYDGGARIEVMAAPPAEGGRFFYAPDMDGFNFVREQATLAGFITKLRDLAAQPAPPAIYAGAASLPATLPGFAADHPFPLAGPEGDAAARVWLGNATQVATHFDMSDNFAVVAVGRRRFTLFPPDAIGDLYIGPLDTTPAGQPVSMVDPLAPDLARFPRFAAAQARALTAELEPGDAIYIPTLWWHHVAATEPINVLVNYWHNDARQGGGFLALVHAILAIRDRPEPERAAWRAWFDHMVFRADAPQSAAHIPLHARGVTGLPSPERDAMIRRFIAQVISSP